MSTRHAVLAALALGLGGCTAAPGSSPGQTAVGPQPRATTCIYQMRSNATSVATTQQPSTILMSNNGWCGAQLSFRHGVVPLATVTDLPAHGQALAREAPVQRLGLYYRPNPGFTGADGFVVSARYGGIDATYLVAVTVAGPDGIFAHDPPPHSLPHGTSVLVQDGTCPAGQIKQVTSGVPRKIACIPHPG